MFDRFTDRARKVMVLARKEAQRFNHNFIGTEHIVFGIIKEVDGVGFQILANHGIDLNAIVKNIEERITTGPPMVLMGQMPFTWRAKEAMEFAAEFACRKGNEHIGTESLLFGLVCKSKDGSESVTYKALAEFGVRQETVEKSVDELLCARKADENIENEELDEETYRKMHETMVQILAVLKAMNETLGGIVKKLIDMDELFRIRGS